MFGGLIPWCDDDEQTPLTAPSFYIINTEPAKRVTATTLRLVQFPFCILQINIYRQLVETRPSLLHS